jgi:hypothetical protein
MSRSELAAAPRKSAPNSNMSQHLQAFQIFQKALRVEVPLPAHLIIAELDKWVGC